MQDDNVITIPNAPWWIGSSHVVLKGLYLAEDEAWIQNHIVSFQTTGAVESRTGDQSILKVQRMVKEGEITVMMRSGQKKQVSLPDGVSKLTPTDLAYIATQIDFQSRPMTAEEQLDFLASANGHVEGTLQVVR